MTVSLGLTGSADSLDIWNICQELDASPQEALVRLYRDIVRNGIGHGGVTYLLDDVRYRDKRGNTETVGMTDVLRLCDDLLDTCNGIAVAYKIFFLLSRDHHATPRELLIEELQEETQAPWWSIEGCVESEIAGRSQLAFFARPRSRHERMVSWSMVQSGILAEYFAQGYDRYFFSLRSSMAFPGWAAFDGLRLASLREAGASDLSQYTGILESTYYAPRKRVPRYLGKLVVLATSLRLHAPMAIEDARENMGRPETICRNATIHRNGWRLVLSAEVVMPLMQDMASRPMLWKSRRRIVRRSLRQARRTANWPLKLLPLGYAYVSVFRRDYRRRRLHGFGLGEDLVCTVRLQRIRRIKSPDIMGSMIEARRNWRVAWNKAWLHNSTFPPEE